MEIIYLSAFGGISVLLIYSLIHHFVRNGDKIVRNELDERQKSIQGLVIAHTLYFGLILLVASGLLTSLNLGFKPNTADQNLIIIFLCASFFLIESLWRGAYFGRKMAKDKLWAALLSFIIYSINALMRAETILSGKKSLLQSGTSHSRRLVVSHFYLVIIRFWIGSFRLGQGI